MTTAAEFRKVQLGPCVCVSCNLCRGTGREYSVTDLDTEPCEDCHGSGVTQVCGRCLLLAEMEHDDE